MFNKLMNQLVNLSIQEVPKEARYWIGVMDQVKPKCTFLEAESSRSRHASHQVDKEKAATINEHEIRCWG